MKKETDTTRLLGAVFLLQAIASAVSGLFLLQPLMVTGNIIETMNNIAGHTMQMRASILVEMITAMGVATLGVLLYTTLKRQDKKIAVIGMGLYLIEAAILAASRIAAFSLLLVSQESVAAGHPESLQTLANLFLRTQSFGYDLHMLPFATGATLFYYLFLRSKALPLTLSLLGIVAAPLALIGSILTLLGVSVPIYLFIANLPFELWIGLFLLFKGVELSAFEKGGVS